MKIATVATGAVGGYLAVRLAQAGHDVATIARGAHLDAIRTNGLTLEGPAGRETITPWIATDNPADVGPVDAILFGVKGDDLDRAAHASLPMLGEDTLVVPFLNGVEAADRLAAIMPKKNVANGLSYIATTIAGPGLITQNGTRNTFVFAERDSTPSPRVKALQQAMTHAGIDAPETPNIERDIWAKFGMFSAMSGVTAAARCTLGDILALPPLAALFRSVIAESIAIGRARGVPLEAGLEDVIWENMQTFPKTLRASTAADLEKGRPLEIEWISGAAVRLGAETGVATPSNQALYAVLLPHKNGR